MGGVLGRTCSLLSRLTHSGNSVPHWLSLAGLPAVVPLGSSFSQSSSELFTGCPLGADIRGALRERTSSREDRIRSTKERKVGERIRCGPALTSRDAELGHTHVNMHKIPERADTHVDRDTRMRECAGPHMERRA